MNHSHSMTHGGHARPHVLPDGLFVGIWVGLLLLTAATVSASVFFPGRIGILVAVLVTPAKASLILMYFMHLKYEKPAFVAMFLVAVGILAIFMGLTFFDYLHR
ncbi:MAG: cytochrome C oxidase subunit IV family protein [Candidatus Krumholzibacteriia bacterium]